MEYLLSLEVLELLCSDSSQMSVSADFRIVRANSWQIRQQDTERRIISMRTSYDMIAIYGNS